MKSTFVTFLATLLASTSAEPCQEDPNHQVGDEWLCDDQCNTCTCPEGTVIATGLCCGADCNVAPSGELASDTMEEAIVNGALFIALIFFVVFIIICFFMCRKGGSKNAAQLVRELEAEED